MNKKAPTFSLKDQLFNREKIAYISELIEDVYPDFLSEDFSRHVIDKFPELELTQRITHIAMMFQKYLPDDFEEAVNILLKALPENQENGTLDNNFGDFIFAPFSEFVATFGLVYIAENTSEYKKHLDFCLNALEKMTQNFSCEFSIRYFLNTHEEETFTRVLEWSTSDNYHVRRLSSEGTRQRLPWGKNINLDYSKTIQILDNLYRDESRYVTRSVANHLNDISKIDAELVVETLKKWSSPQPWVCPSDSEGAPTGEGVTNDLNFIISHSTRGLVKQGHTETLVLLGYSPNPKTTVSSFTLKNNTVKVGNSLEFEFELSSPQKENLIIDYKIYFQNKSGKLSPKVFKIKKIEGFGGKSSTSLIITKKHPLKMMTTKALYEGEHQVEIIINSRSFGKKNFKLLR